MIITKLYLTEVSAVNYDMILFDKNCESQPFFLFLLTISFLLNAQKAVPEYRLKFTEDLKPLDDCVGLTCLCRWTDDRLFAPIDPKVGRGLQAVGVIFEG